ncbi:hypothetical protein HU200_058183 [Digitaria exilis]|uniref:Peptidase M48 domain-containing protein n=1 Tax=Digitaria exilis TaxID=1010633 RepID=A0A835AA15_9POAL|nr:hypothetical protein HU200_058183 [Digitaria exilis]
MNCLRTISRSVLPLVRKPPPPLRHYHTFLRVPGDGRSPQAVRRYQHTTRRSSKQTRFDWARHGRLAGAASLVAGVALCSRREAVPYTDRTRLIVLSPKAERWLGELVFNDEKQKLGSKVLPPLDPQSVRVRRIASEIAAAAVRRRDAPPRLMKEPPPPRGVVVINDDWEVIVVKDNMVNAVCFPGGKIIVYTGLLDKFREDAEVATILGHEVGHAVARHVAESLTTHLWHIVLQVVILQFIHIPDKMLDAMSKYLLELPFSRRMEMEADHVGLMLLAAAGYDPRVAPSVYERLGGNTGDSKLLNYISTHPSSQKRSQLLSREHVMNEALELYHHAAGAQGFLPDSAGTQVADSAGTQVEYGK